LLIEAQKGFLMRFRNSRDYFIGQKIS
jgi:hypothetical protein